MSEGETIFAGVLGGLLGYSISSNKIKGWENFIKECDKRFDHLTYFKVVLPKECFEKSKNSQAIYIEGVQAYLLGLPNASLPMLSRFFEIVLKSKYTEIEDRPVPKRWGLFKLIDWAEKYLKDKKEIAHGFRELRNLIHTDKVITEQDNIIAIQYISRLSNMLYSFKGINLSSSCPYCRTFQESKISKEQYFIGNRIQISCTCQRTYNLTVTQQGVIV